MTGNPKMLAAGIIEFFGGSLIALGIAASLAAFIACGEMAYAFFTVHYPRGFWPIMNGGEPAVLYCFFFLYVALRGSGRYSIEGLVRRN
jgi:putative oxidoreductase